ncbi:MAG: Ubiquinone/menaquinone biosynthesis C-methyltransferase UbiE [Candidatus Heimdallarchaeota archaeon LC_3]|nr:MAG: Ubiquinone/menaquinone biosynthesis C-methyltransferase UbiE [Candidatus Heimdallarchaeota archaeon LC_3]
MFNKLKLPRNYSKALKNLELLKLDKEIWIDAGCGKGTYSIPLSFFVDKVIALDTNKYNLETLNNFIKDNKITNIESFIFDFNNKYKILFDNVDGILYSFSLHFQKEISNVLNNSFDVLKKNGGRVVIIEYERKIPVPWIPYPITEKKMIELLQKAKFDNISRIFKNNRYYILEAII